ncbi:MFS transporter [Salicibibacter halophilus]|uniref:MFS transporter n=1 Tax=Salicibibacter halophilus TaxID=2502791 RepID=A0A514LND8_9BACI|nr:MFS transporter [Salicibibacter halophilus]QDI93145.1 MFS transporter [Salicibibacter halophilus]
MNKKTLIAIVAIVFVAFNLRPAITSVGPLVGIIRDDLGITNSQAGFITTVPLLAFACFSIVAPILAKKWGIEWAIFLGLATLFIGILLRSFGISSMLFIGTAIVGVGVAVCNVLLPGFVKQKFDRLQGVMTSVYTTSMSLFATIASGLSIPLVFNFNLEWNGSLATWSIIAVIGLICWAPLLRGTNANLKKERSSQATGGKLWHSPLAWQVTAFMGLQSMLYYSMVTWLPEIVQANGIPIATAGMLLAYMQLSGLPMTFITPILATRMQNQRAIIVVIVFFYFFAMSGLLYIGDSLFAHLFFITLLGGANGASISLSLVLFNLRTRSASQASQLSGMAQSFGYLLAATGPILLGSIFDFTGSWFIPLIILSLVIIILLIAGLFAGRDSYVFSEQSAKRSVI